MQETNDLELDNGEKFNINQGPPPNQGNINNCQAYDYSLPGIIHYLEHQWANFEAEKSSWDIEKAELQAKISFLQGERNGQENIKRDLVRRVKMLEFALIQERMQSGTQIESQNNDEIYEPLKIFNETEIPPPKQGSQILQQYLKEIGYADSVIAAKSQNVRAMVELSHDMSDNANFLYNDMHNNNEYPYNKSQYDNKFAGHIKEAGLKIYNELPITSQSLNLGISQSGLTAPQNVSRKAMIPPENNNINDSFLDVDQDEALNEFNFLSSSSLNVPNHDNRNQETFTSNKADEIEKPHQLNNYSATLFGHDEDYDKNGKTWHIRASLRGHLDSIRAVAFHPLLPCLLTASEDSTLKYWNLEPGNSPNKKNSSSFSDIESLVTYRFHKGPVLTVSYNSTGDMFLSGGIDGKVICWKSPPLDYDQFEYDEIYQNKPTAIFHAHTDAVWACKWHPLTHASISCSADGTLVIYYDILLTPKDQNTPVDDIKSVPTSIKRLHSPHSSAEHIDSATSLDILPYDNYKHVAVSYVSSRIVIFDIEAQTPVCTIQNDDGSNALQINMIACHPTYPIILSCYNDNVLRFFCAKTGKCVDKMAAHLDVIACVCFDPYGLCYLTGSHDNTIRLWSYESKNCIQEITSHRKKFDEGVNAVSFHPSLSYMSSAGADSIAKIFVLL